MFQNNRYLTRGVSERIPIDLQIILWNALETLPEPKDYFQVFRLSVLNGIHDQEQPPYKREYLLPTIETLITAKVYIIDDGDHSTS